MKNSAAKDVDNLSAQEVVKLYRDIEKEAKMKSIENDPEKFSADDIVEYANYISENMCGGTN